MSALRRAFMHRRCGQSLVEYVILIMIVTLALSTMFTLSKRATQSLIKAGADQIGTQAGAEQTFNKEQGYLVNSITLSSGNVNHQTVFAPGNVYYLVNDVIGTNTVSFSVAGEKEATP